MKEYNMKLNINDKVKVKLTPHGESILGYENPVFYKRDFDIKNKILKVQLWMVMDIFGDYIGGGCEQVFVDDNIYIKKV
jgi:hypothetical protein